MGLFNRFRRKPVVRFADLEARVETNEVLCQSMSELMAEALRVVREQSTTIARIERQVYRKKAKESEEGTEELFNQQAEEVKAPAPEQLLTFLPGQDVSALLGGA